MVDMTFNQLVERKRKLERDLTALLTEFYKETGCTPKITQGPQKWERADTGATFDMGDDLSLWARIRV